MRKEKKKSFRYIIIFLIVFVSGISIISFEHHRSNKYFKFLEQTGKELFLKHTIKNKLTETETMLQNLDIPNNLSIGIFDGKMMPLYHKYSPQSFLKSLKERDFVMTKLSGSRKFYDSDEQVVSFVEEKDNQQYIIFVSGIDRTGKNNVNILMCVAGCLIFIFVIGVLIFSICKKRSEKRKQEPDPI